MIKIHFIDRNQLPNGLYLDVTFGFEDSAREAWKLGGYTHVATFNDLNTTADLDKAWHHTNNGNGQTDSWSREPSHPVEIVAPFPTADGKILGHRSSMVGDIFETADGALHAVAAFGFKRI